MKRLAIIALAFGLSSGGAEASELFSTLKAGDCRDGQVPNAVLRDAVLAAEKVPLTVPIATALVENRLGTLAREKETDCLGRECKDADDALQKLHHNLLALSDAQPLVPAGFTIAIDAAAAPPREARVETFLNGQWSWLSVRCATTLAGTTPPSVKPEPEKPSRPSDPEPAQIVLAKTEEDAGKDFGKRGFASFGVSSDREADETAWDIDAYLGLDAPFLGLGSELELQPFVSLQYHTQKKVDDLSFGGALMWYPGNAGHLVRLKGAWETDINFRSSVWRSDLGWTPPWFDLCEEQSVPDRVFANCELTLVGDIQNISDAGSKEALLKLDSFGRAGFDLRLAYGRSVGEKFGFVTAGAGFSLRRNPGSSQGNAELFTASLGLSPSDAGAWKISIDYTVGRDLTELTKQDKIVLTVGFRH